MGEIAATRIIANWKGDFVADACIAATQIGLLQSGNMLGYDRAINILRLNFDARRVGDIHWSTVYQSFQNGRATVISNIELRKQFLPVAANDNKSPEDDSIDAETLLGMNFPELAYVIPRYVVEGLTILGGKPKLGKSWLAYDIGIAVATGGKAMGTVDCEQGDVSCTRFG